MIADACRFFRQDPDYWEDALTLRRHRAQQNSLSRLPPVEAFVGMYFRGRKWWDGPPIRSGDETPVEQQTPECATLPEFEP